jgi:hypothetical protein
MRLGLSTVLVAALAAGLVACSSSTGDTGAGGSGGAGEGGGVTTGEGGSTTTGEGGSGGGGQTCADDCACVLELVEIGAACDADCDATFGSDTADMCTVTCSEALPCGSVDDGTLECATDGTNSVCVYTCNNGDACPGGYVCDEAAEFKVCIPDTPDV